jgi:hypothetical protein
MRTHNGEIDVQSAPGLGTTFTIDFPQPEARSALAPATKPVGETVVWANA